MEFKKVELTKISEIENGILIIKDGEIKQIQEGPRYGTVTITVVDKAITLIDVSHKLKM